MLAIHPLENAAMTGEQLLARIERVFTAATPLVDYLCAALDLDL